MPKPKRSSKAGGPAIDASAFTKGSAVRVTYDEAKTKAVNPKWEEYIYGVFDGIVTAVTPTSIKLKLTDEGETWTTEVLLETGLTKRKVAVSIELAATTPAQTKPKKEKEKKKPAPAKDYSAVPEDAEPDSLDSDDGIIYEL